MSLKAHCPCGREMEQQKEKYGDGRDRLYKCPACSHVAIVSVGLIHAADQIGGAFNEAVHRMDLEKEEES